MNVNTYTSVLKLKCFLPKWHEQKLRKIFFLPLDLIDQSLFTLNTTILSIKPLKNSRSHVTSDGRLVRRSVGQS